MWVSDAGGRTASVTEFPEGVGFTDVWTVPGEEEFAAVYRAGGPFDLPLARIHEHLVPYHAMQIEDFIDAVRDDREPAVTGREAIGSLEIVQGIYESGPHRGGGRAECGWAPERDRASGGDGTAAR